MNHTAMQRQIAAAMPLPQLRKIRAAKVRKLKDGVKSLKGLANHLNQQLNKDIFLQDYVGQNCPGSLGRFDEILEAIRQFQENF